MKTSIATATLTFFLTSHYAFAHGGGHGGPEQLVKCKVERECTQDEVGQAAQIAISKLVGAGKIAKSWTDVKTAEATEKKNREWLVTFKNPKEADKTKQVLYVFVGTAGHLFGANFTGKQ